MVYLSRYQSGHILQTYYGFWNHRFVRGRMLLTMLLVAFFYVYDNHTYTQLELTFPNLQGVQVSVHFLHVAHSDEFYLK